jgi:hypothetical protein
MWLRSSNAWFSGWLAAGVAASDLSRQKQAEPHQWCHPEFLAREPIKIGNFSGRDGRFWLAPEPPPLGSFACPGGTASRPRQSSLSSSRTFLQARPSTRMASRALRGFQSRFQAHQSHSTAAIGTNQRCEIGGTSGRSCHWQSQAMAHRHLPRCEPGSTPGLSGRVCLSPQSPQAACGRISNSARTWNCAEINGVPVHTRRAGPS